MEADGLILVGGESRRMGGRHKGDLLFQGQPIEERMIGEFRREAETVWISYGTQVRREYPGCPWILDEYPGCGPMGGLYTGLIHSRNPLMLVSACDMPFLTAALYRHLLEALLEAEQEQGRMLDGAVPVAEGRVHPLAAVYRKSFAPVLKKQILKGNYRMMDGLKEGKIWYVDLTGKEELAGMLANVNTVSQYQSLFGRPKVIAVCGVKNSGKTTLLVQLVKALAGKGFKTAVIKHDGHDFTCDIPGTDSFRFMEAGAFGTAVYSEGRTFIHRLGKSDVEDIIGRFPEADILFVEGMKGSSYPKIEVIRRGISETPVSNPEGRFLIVTDWEAERFSEASLSFSAVEEIVERIIGEIRK